MTPSEYIAAILLVCGGLFFFAGTVGLLRFPDLFTRLHAITKADNVGLGLIVLGLMVQAESWLVMGKLLLIWILVLFAGASVSHLIARRALQKEGRKWKQ